MRCARVGLNMLKFEVARARHDILVDCAKHDTKHEQVLLSWVYLTSLFLILIFLRDNFIKDALNLIFFFYQKKTLILVPAKSYLPTK